MSEISRVALFGKLNKLGYQGIESATVFCKMRGNPYVEVVHWFQQILQGQDSDLHRIIQHFDMDPSKVAKEMTAALDALPRGASSISDLSDHLENAVERAWVYASLAHKSPAVRTGHLVLGMAKTGGLKNVLTGMTSEFSKVKADALLEEFDDIVGGSPEDGLGPQDGTGIGAGAGAAPGEASGAMAPASMGKEEALQQFCKDLTAQAQSGEIDQIVASAMTEAETKLEAGLERTMSGDSSTSAPASPGSIRAP